MASSSARSQRQRSAFRPADPFGVRAGEPVGLRGYRRHQVRSLGRQPGGAHQRGDLGPGGALACLGREHGDNRLGQLAVTGPPGLQPGPFQRRVRGQLGDGSRSSWGCWTPSPAHARHRPRTSCVTWAGRPRRTASTSRRRPPGSRPADRHHGGQPVGLEVLPGQADPERPGQDRPVPPTTRPVAVSSQQSAPVSRPISRSMASTAGPRPPRTAGACAARAPWSWPRPGRRSGGGADLLGHGGEGSLGRHREHGDAVLAARAGLHSGLHLTESLPGAEHPGPRPGPGPGPHRTASAGSRHQIMPVRTRSPGVR